MSRQSTTKSLRHLVLSPRAVIRFLKDKRAPIGPKIMLALAVIYAVIPVDLIPDIAPILGWLDDIGVFAASMTWLASAVAKHEREIEGGDGAPAPGAGDDDVKKAPT